MNFWLSVLLGFVQGAAEFLPISSSGHLAILQNLFSEAFAGVTPEEEMLFDVLLHVGSLAAVFVAFWKDVKEIAAAFFGLFTKKGRQDGAVMPARRLILLLIAATAPLVLVLFFHGLVDDLMKNMYFVGGALIITGILLFVADRVKPGRKSEKSARLTDAFFIGLAQVLAVLPGISRSGATISTGVIRGCGRSFAVRFSFLMSIPAVLGATLLQVVKAAKEGIDVKLLMSFVPGMLVAAAAGYAAIMLVRMLAAKGKFGGFAYYCSVVGAAVLIITAVTGGG